MENTDKINNKKQPSTKHPLDRQFDSVEEAAKAKKEYLMNVILKGVDLSSLKK